ncbi:MAG: serine hydrolase domain-containing protein, partial [Fimbriimonas sp.]
TLAQIDRAVDKVMADNNIPGAVIDLNFPGRGTYRAAKGVTDRATGEPMSLDNHFRVGSNTKAFTGTVILQLVDEGLITLDQKVGTILDGVPNGDNISIRHLLTMTSGLPNYSDIKEFNDRLWSDPYYQYTTQELLDIAYSEDNHPGPGTHYEYSNTNTILLGEIIRAKTGLTVAQAFQTRLFDPLGLTQTSWPTTPVMPTPYAHGYTDDNPTRTIMDATNWNPSWAGAAGQLVSTVDDMATWARSAGTGSLISAEMQRQRLDWIVAEGIPPGRYGLHIGQSGKWIHHQGELPGYNTIAAYLPPYDGTLVVLTSSNVPYDAMGPAAKIMVAIGEIVAPEYTPTPPPSED